MPWRMKNRGCTMEGMVSYMKNKWQKDLVRFSVEFGPASLFERAYFKMRDVHSLKAHGQHYMARISERHIPVCK